MNFIKLFIIALTSLIKEFGRTFLSLLGVIVSVAAIMIVLSLGANIDLYVKDQLSVFGGDTVQIETAVPSNEDVALTDAAARAQITTLTDDDARAIEKLPSVETVSVGVTSQARMTWNSNSKQTILLGVDANAPLTDAGVIMEQGRFFTDAEVVGNANVVVLGKVVAEDIFGVGRNPVGERIRIAGQTYRVIGINEERGSLFGFNYDDLAYVPYTSLTEEIMGIDHLAYITATSVDPTQAENTADDVRSLLRIRRGSTAPGDDDFIVTTIEEAQDFIGNIVGAVSLLLGALASVSMIVGGVGIMNMMLMSVEERKREIGLRKALGASPRDILIQFVIESVTIAVVAALIGITIGGILLVTIGNLAVTQGVISSYKIPLSAPLIATLFSCGAGILFGVYPARTAARIAPTAAMR